MENLYRYGGSDPFWSDGCNLNLVRNHILYYKNQLKEMNPIPEAFYKETPPEVDQSYMARTDEIRVNAAKSLRAYLASEDYIYLHTYVSGLRQDILSDDLVAMRRHEKPKHYIESFHECRIKLERMSESNQIPRKFDPGNQISGQMSIEDWENEY